MHGAGFGSNDWTIQGYEKILRDLSKKFLMQEKKLVNTNSSTKMVKSKMKV